jgi:uncharacterized protein YkwD
MGQIYRITFMLLIAVTLLIMHPVTASAFSDVSKNHWAYDEILGASKNGDIQGYPDGTFKPDNTVTLAEFLKLAIVAAEGSDPGPSKEGHWYSNYLNLAIRRGVLDGNSYGAAKLGRPANRGEVAEIAALSIIKALNMANSCATDNLSTGTIHDVNGDLLAKILPAIELGLMYGYPDNTFRPAKTLTRAEAVVIASRIASRIKSYNLMTEDVLKYTNEARQKNGLPALRLNENLSKAAKAKALDMAVNNCFSHVTPACPTLFGFLEEHNITCNSAGENLAKNINSGKAIVDAWMKSESHRNNILNGGYNSVGIGCHKIGKDLYVVQFFINDRN